MEKQTIFTFVNIPSVEVKRLGWKDPRENLFVVFHLMVEYNGKKVTTERRYHDFYMLNSRLHKQLEGKYPALPFTPIRPFGFLDTEMAETERRHLKAFMNAAVLPDHPFSKTAEFNSFLNPNSTVYPCKMGRNVNESMAIFMCGQMTKRGHVVKNWKSRWFVLQMGCLLYYKNDADLVPAGLLYLSKNAKARAVMGAIGEGETLKRDNCIVVEDDTTQEMDAEAEKKSRIKHRLIISVPNPDLQMKWVEAINQASTSILESEAQVSSRALYKEGYLLKRGHLRKNWKSRFFVLERGRLRYYANPTDSNEKGIIHLPRGSRVIQREDLDNRRNILCIETVSNSMVKKYLPGMHRKDDVIISCKDAHERASWFEAISRVCQCGLSESDFVEGAPKLYWGPGTMNKAEKIKPETTKKRAGRLD